MNTTPRFSQSLVSFAGHDPLGGAGLVVDAKVFRSHDFTPFTVPTCLTVQDHKGVHDVSGVPTGFMTRAARALHGAVPPVGVKVGLVPSAGHINELCDILKELSPRHVVCDPVLGSSGGQSLLPDSINTAFARLFSLCSVITPNLGEAMALSGASTAEDAAAALLKNSPGLDAVVITGVPAPAESGYGDMVALRDENPAIIEAPAADRGREIHGTGCHYSSALLCALARGQNPAAAVTTAQRFLAETIAKGRIPLPGDMDMLP